MSESDDTPTVEAYNAETGEYLGEGEVVEPEYSRWQRAYYRFKRTVSRNPRVVFLLATASLLVFHLGTIL